MGARALWVRGRREPWLGALGLLGTLGLVLMPVYLAVRHYRYVLGDDSVFIWDFSYYYEAAGRFLGDPLALYADPEFLYPPPSVLAFLPWRAFSMPVAYLLSQGVIVVTVAAALVLALGTWEQARAERLPVGTKALLVLTGLGTAPVFQSLKYGQISPLILLVGVAAVWLVQRDRPVAAALALAGGFWLKLYPLVLLPLGRHRWRRFAAGLVIGLVVVPVLLLPVLPAELYLRYFTEHLPASSALTTPFALNASIAGVAARLGEPLTAFQARGFVDLGLGARAAPLAVGLGVGGGLTALWFRRCITVATAGAGLLALVPVVSPLGWEHVYVLALPLVLFALVAVRPVARRRWRAIAVLGTLAFFLPTLPAQVMAASFAWWPRPVHDLLYARLVLTVLALLFVTVASDLRETRSPNDTRPGGSRYRGARGEAAAATR